MTVTTKTTKAELLSLVNEQQLCIQRHKEQQLVLFSVLGIVVLITLLF